VGVLVMPLYWQDSHTTLYQGDAREVLRGLPVVM